MFGLVCFNFRRFKQLIFPLTQRKVSLYLEMKPSTETTLKNKAARKKLPLWKNSGKSKYHRTTWKQSWEETSHLTSYPMLHIAPRTQSNAYSYPRMEKREGNKRMWGMFPRPHSRHEGTEKWGTLSKSVRILSGRAGIWTQGFSF
jgi:hypothetical protein